MEKAEQQVDRAIRHIDNCFYAGTELIVPLQSEALGSGLDNLTRSKKPVSWQSKSRKKQWWLPLQLD
jgi:hypothetical protein